MARKRNPYTVGKRLELDIRWLRTGGGLTVTIKRIDRRLSSVYDQHGYPITHITYVLAVVGEQRVLVMSEDELKQREYKPQPIPLPLAG